MDMTLGEKSILTITRYVSGSLGFDLLILLRQTPIRITFVLTSLVSKQ